MKKLIALFMVMILVLALSGCSSATQQPAEPTAQITKPVEDKQPDEAAKTDENKQTDDITKPVDENKTDETTKPAEENPTGDSNGTGEEIISDETDNTGTEKVPQDASSNESDDKETAKFLGHLRSISEAGVSDFDINNAGDELEHYLVGGWFHELVLLRDGKILGWFAVADDLSAVCRVNGDNCTLIAGSLENTLKRTQTYTVYNEDEDRTYDLEEDIVSAIVIDGTELTVGTFSEVTVVSPWDSLLESLSVVSSDPGVVEVNGREITAQAPGEAVLTVSYVYGGSPKTDEIPVEVLEEDPDMEYFEAEYIDEKYSTYFDRVSQRATLEICHEDGLYSVDILWSDSATVMHHWSYISTEENNGSLKLNGTYCIETSNYDGTVSTETVFENMGATLTLGDDGCYYWHDDYEDAGKECIFEKPY